MADDDMLINFDVGSAPFVPQQKFKGGRWKDRLQAKKSLQRRRESVEDGTKNGVNAPYEEEPGVHNYDFVIEQPAKRARPSRPAGSSGANHSHGREHRKDGQPLQVVSSLFTFNPSATIAQPPTENEAAPAEPSNAPLSPEIQNFTSLGLSTTIAEHLLNKMTIKAPTSVQREAVAELLNEDADAFIQAETGSGKTLAYLLPIVQRLSSASSAAKLSDPSHSDVHRDSGLFAIILAPTRELSAQISVVLSTLLRCCHHIVSTTVTGGEKKKSEKARLRKGVNILIATPGRLADHLQHTEVLDVSKVRWLVMDEGDRLMEMGFEKDIEQILSKLENAGEKPMRVPGLTGLPERRVTILCSATMKMGVLKLGERSLKDAIHIRGSSQADDNTNGPAVAGSKGETPFSAPAQLQQSFAVVPAKLRLVTLAALLKRTFARKGSVMKVMVFMSCADSVDFHYSVFTSPSASSTTTHPAAPASATKSMSIGNKTASTSSNPAPNDTASTSAASTTLSTKDIQVQISRLHGSLPQPVRTSTLTSYRRSSTPSVLLCTDVASRGLDLPNVDFVIEYDPPFSKDDHLHRIGRTARAGQAGRAMIFLQPGCEEGYVDVLKSERGEAGRTPNQQNADDILRKGFSAPGLEEAGKGWREKATDWQLQIERWALEDPKVLEQARRAYQSYVRAYATHVAAERGMFDMTQLHLGHLAKAFGLRDKPGAIRVPGLRPDANASKGERKAKAGKRKKGDEEEIREAVDLRTAEKKMRAKMKEETAVSEFNLG